MNSETKTILEWSYYLPKQIGDSLRRQSKKLGYEASSLAGAINSAFVWSNTVEGYPYWSDINNKVNTGSYSTLQGTHKPIYQIY